MSTLWGSFEIRNARLAKKMMAQLANKPLEGDQDEFNRWADRFEQLPMHFLKFFGSTSVSMLCHHHTSIRGRGTAQDAHGRQP